MKKTYIEFLRTAACFFVIVNHTNSRIFMGITPGPAWLCSVVVFFVSKTAVPLFLMIMGALLLDKEAPPGSRRGAPDASRPCLPCSR